MRVPVALVTSVLALLLLAPLSVALAAPPEHVPTVSPPLEFPAGEVCEDAILFENLVIRARDSYFAPGPDGDQRILTRGAAVSRVTNLETGTTFDFRGGVRMTFIFASDGSLRVDAGGRDYIAWYYPGDDSDLEPGLYQLNGHLTEWYAADGTFIRATFSGVADDLCARVGA